VITVSTTAPRRATLPSPSPSGLGMGAVFLSVLTAAVVSLIQLQINFATLADSAGLCADFARRMLPLDFPSIAETSRLTGQTLSVVVCATLLSAVLSLPVAVMAAANTTINATTRAAARGAIVLARALPDLVLVIVAFRVFGLGGIGAVLAMAIHSVGMIGKLFADAVEDIDDGVRTAVRATGASRTQQFVAGVVPQVLPSFVATLLHRLDINLRVSVVLGFVGVAGLGAEIAHAAQRLDYQRAMALALVVFVLCVVMELLSGAIRRRLLTPHARHGTWWSRRRARVRARSTALKAPESAGPEGVDAPGPGGRRPAGPVYPRRGSGGQRRTLRGTGRGLVAALCATALLLVCVRGADLSIQQVLLGRHHVLPVLDQFLPPSTGGILGELLDALWTTVRIALAGTLLGFALALPCGVLAARNVSPSPSVAFLARTLILGIRGIPELILAIVLVIATGLGPAAGTLALALGSVGFLGKLVADTLEELDPGPRTALLATGATRTQAFFAATLRQALPALAAHFLHQLDVNVRSATLLGIVGAGGIGYYLINASRVQEFGVVTTVILMVLGVVLAVEGLAVLLRRSLF
jgi:phosphonate transport system permease protein